MKLMRNFLFLLLTLFSLVFVESSWSQEGRFRFIGSEHCTWDREGAAAYFYVPDRVTADSCRQWAETVEGSHYLGEGESKWAEASKIPTDACSCGQKWRNMYFDPQYLTGGIEPQACRGISYACSKPGTDCRWMKADSLTEDITYTEECRLKAGETGDPYYGYNSETEASKVPETSCICGESMTKWYSNFQPPQSADFKCIGIKYRCLKKAFIMKESPYIRPLGTIRKDGHHD